MCYVPERMLSRGAVAMMQRYGALGGGANVQGFTSSPGDQHSQQTSHPGYGRAGLAMGPPRRSCSSPTAMSAPAQPNHSPPAGCGPALGRTTTPGPGPMPAPHLVTHDCLYSMRLFRPLLEPPPHPLPVIERLFIIGMAGSACMLDIVNEVSKRP